MNIPALTRTGGTTQGRDLPARYSGLRRTLQRLGETFDGLWRAIGDLDRCLGAVLAQATPNTDLERLHADATRRSLMQRHADLVARIVLRQQ